MGAEALAVLITPAYAQENARLHEVDPTFGAEGHAWGYLVAGIAYVEDCETILDYGCGKGSLAEAVGPAVFEYDPAIPGKDEPPISCGLVACLDVLEHVELACLDDVLNDLARLARKKLFVVISTKRSKRLLSDGRDSHLIVRNGEDWRATFEAKGFTVKREWETGLRQWVALMDPPC